MEDEEGTHTFLSSLASHGWGVEVRVLVEWESWMWMKVEASVRRAYVRPPHKHGQTV